MPNTERVPDNNDTNDLNRLREALVTIEEMSSQQTDGKWLEQLTADCAPLIAEWDVCEAWKWDDWPGKEYRDCGIDVVAKRHDGKHIAIQCKSRQLGDNGEGNPINRREINSFIAESTIRTEDWEELWLVVNGAVGTSSNADKVLCENNVKQVNLHSDIRKHLDATSSNIDEDQVPREEVDSKQTRDAMQQEAVEIAVGKLKAQANSGKGDARGKIILPCGTGKSRIALRIIETLTEAGEISAILCPSIALVAQLRREFLVNSSKQLMALAVCSDQTAAQSSDLSKDQTADLSQASTRGIKGSVTTDPAEIVRWMDAVPQDSIGVIFGTYQSSHKIADALQSSSKTITVMVADEAHRTAGIRRVKGKEGQLRDFTVCHNQLRFRAKYRIYQTATPKVYKTERQRNAEWRVNNREWITRSMDDEDIFGPEIYRKDYRDAVNNGWLSDYRIIALGVNDEEAYKTANQLATDTKGLSTSQFLRGLVLALVMGGGTRKNGHNIRSSINFMNTVDRSKKMTEALQSATVRQWVGHRLAEDGVCEGVNKYHLQHLDAKSNVEKREQAIAQLVKATEAVPQGILNVGIFGEGTDAPSLSAVGFLEPRKSPVEVIQAVGRVMRRAEEKQLGYVLCPILIPRNTDAESWLANSSPEDGWQALGQILRALRAHDSRIEDELSDLMKIYLPPRTVEDESTVVALGIEHGRASYHMHTGKPGTVETHVENTLNGKEQRKDVFEPLSETLHDSENDTDKADEHTVHPLQQCIEPNRIVSGKKNSDGSIEIREQGIERDRPRADGTPGPINIKKTKKTAKDMLNGKTGRKIPRHRKTAEERAALKEQQTLNLLQQSKADDMGIFVNLLEKSGLCRNKAKRSVNTIEEAIREAKHCLKEEELDGELNNYFGLDQQIGKDRADGCTIAALLLMNAAMLHHRIAAGRWLDGVDGLDNIKSHPDAADQVHRQWNKITRHDFLPVIEPAIEIIEKIQDTGRKSGLNKAVRHIAGEAQRLAEDYAEMGADYAGELFNKIMGNQTSDGAFFTRPESASLLARLTLDVVASKADWTTPNTWQANKITDLACGSGTLLAASLTEMKRRAQERGASTQQLAELQKLAVEETLCGLDINIVSLQLAAAQLTAGNVNVPYRNMGLYRMPYGPEDDQVKVGSLELLGQRKIVPRPDELDLHQSDAVSEQLEMRETAPALVDGTNPALVDGTKAALGARVIMMNPPFTERTKMGEKYPMETRERMRERVDSFEDGLVSSDPEMEDFVSRRSIGPMFVALAERCLDSKDGTLAMIRPTIVLTGVAAAQERILLAKRFHIHTLLTSHQPSQPNLSQNTKINESIIIAKRHSGEDSVPPTRIINLDKLPLDESSAADLHSCLDGLVEGLIPYGWGEVSEWPAEYMEAGNWIAAAFRSPILAKATAEIATKEALMRLMDQGASSSSTAPTLSVHFTETEINSGFPILKSKGEDAQKCITAKPDQYWIHKKQDHAETARLLEKAENLLVTAGQNISTARLTAVVSDKKYVGLGWQPVRGLSLIQAKAVAVFLNSTLGRLQLLGKRSQMLTFPIYNPAVWKDIRCPALSDKRICTILADCWQQTADIEVPQYRDGECEVRRLWDEAVADALEWDKDGLAELRDLLHKEPYVRGLGYNEFG